MAAGMLLNGYKEGAVVAFNYFEQSYPSCDNRGGPFLTTAIRVIEKQHFTLRINHCLPILWNALDGLIAREYNPVLLPTFRKPNSIFFLRRKVMTVENYAQSNAG